MELDLKILLMNVACDFFTSFQWRFFGLIYAYFSELFSIAELYIFCHRKFLQLSVQIILSCLNATLTICFHFCFMIFIHLFTCDASLAKLSQNFVPAHEVCSLHNNLF